MKTRVLFVQGAGNEAHDKWDSKLVDDLKRKLGAAYEVEFPQMPDEADPNYARWSIAILRELSKLGEGAIIVGHSLGGTFLLNVLAEKKVNKPPAALFLIAPAYIGAGGWPSDEIAEKTDLGSLLPEASIFLYHGTRDETIPLEHSRLYAGAIPQAVVRRLEGRDHQLNNNLTEVAEDIHGLET